MNPGIGLRDCERTDLLVCARIAAEVFPSHSRRFPGEETRKVMRQLQADCCHAVSNYHELAVVDGEVAGFLFGRLKRTSVLIDMCQTLKRLLLIKVRFLLGRYGSRRKLISLAKLGLQEWRLLRRNMPASEAEVVLFAVAPQHQGKGVGRALMNHFVRQALKHEATAVSVPTDETASFWFYERYGFRRWAEYRSPLESFLAGRPIKAFTYLLLLRPTSGQEPER